MPTNGVFGFIQMLLRIIRETNPEFLCVTFDSKAPTFRKEIYPEYKANRAAMPDDLEKQIPYVYRMLDAFGIRYLIKSGYEADDIIATLVQKAEDSRWQTRVITADKDLFQLVSDHTHILRFGKKDIEEYDAYRVVKKMGVAPEKITDFLGLTGDSSDNIPGVAGVGPVTAKKLLKQFPSLEKIVEKPSLIRNERLRGKIENEREQALLSKRLATVKKDVPINFNLDEFALNIKLTPEVEAVFEELEFKSLLEILRQDNDFSAREKRKVNYRILRQTADIEGFFRKALLSEYIAIDTETTSTDPMRCRLVGISLSYKAGEAVYIPIAHVPEMAGGRHTLEKLTPLITPLLLSNKVKKCGHNIKYDINVLNRVGLEIKNITFDTMLASYLLSPDKASHSLKIVAPEELNIAMKPITNLLGKGKQSITIDRVDVKKAADYACLDADATFELRNVFEQKLKQSGLENLYHTLEVPLIFVLAEMERNGIAIDAAYFERLSSETKKNLEGLRGECYKMAGHEFNLNSPKQVAGVLFDELGLPPVKKGKTGYSTDVTVLQTLSPNHPLPKKLLEYRVFEKLFTTYIDALPRQVHPDTGRIHTSFIQTGTATGRLSSREPNLQNIPVRTPQGRAIRRGFIPGEKGWVLLSADYSQIELRILAHISKDAMLVQAFNQGKDIHTLTASRIFDQSEEFITSEMRGAAKTINFGVIYGMSAHRLAKELEISFKEAKKFIDDYFLTYKGVNDWIDKTIREAREKGYVKTMLGRLRYVPDLKNANRNIRAAAERVAVNTPIQGTCADMIKKAMIAIHHQLKQEKLKTRLLIQVHDELIFEVPEQEINRIKQIVTEKMETAVPLAVPVKVGIKIGYNWADC